MSEQKKLSRAERDKRRRARQERISNRAKYNKEREEAIRNTMQVNMFDNSKNSKGKNNNKSKNNKGKLNSKVIDRNNDRKEKRGEKVKFKDLSLKRKFLRIFKWLFITGVILFLIGALAAALVVYSVYKDENNKMTAQDLLINQFNSEVYDRDGKLIATLSENEKRRKIDLKDMGDYLPKAYIAIEDERYYSHHGMDFKRTAGAVLQFITKKGDASYGGSTITQQLVKNLTNDKDRTWNRKVKELVRAYQVEKQLSKDEILELYLNLIFVGGSNINGVSLGADHYFAKEVKDLKISEAAFMAGINHSPAVYSPYIEKGESETEEAFNARKTRLETRTRERTSTVLGKMLELGYITKDQYDQAITEVNNGLEFKRGTASDSTIRYSAVVDAAISEAIEKYKEKNEVAESVAKLAIYNGGLKIYTTQNSELQAKVEEEMKKSKYLIKSKKNPGKTAQAASVVVDHTTGEILAAVGGLGEDTQMIKGTWNRVSRTQRQTGSTMKTIGVVAPGIESGKLNASTVFNDEPINWGGYKPKNYTGRFQGYMTLRHALTISQNIPMLKALQQIGIDTSYDFLKSMDLPVTEDDKTVGALALGGLSRGFTVQDMAGAYGMIANDGQFIKPTYISKIVDNNQKEIYKYEPTTKKIMSKESAYIVKDMLTDVVESPNGTSPYAKVPNFQIAAKTGTTNDDKDRWLVGFSPKYTTAVWYGYDDPETVVFSGANPAGQIFANVMKEAHKGLKGERFKRPEGLEETDVCIVSGLKPSALCARDPRGSMVQKELFLKGKAPKEVCDIHIEVEVSKESGLLADSNYPADAKEKRVFIKQSGSTEDAKYNAPTQRGNEYSEASRKEREEAQKNISTINSVYEKLNSLTVSDISRLESAISAYSKLSSENKEKLSESSKANAEKAQEKLTELKKKKETTSSSTTGSTTTSSDPAVVRETQNLINNLPEASTVTAANKESADTKARAARAKYNSLTAAQKAEINSLSKLTALEAKIRELN